MNGGPRLASPENMRWVGGWATTPSATDGIALQDQTVRMIAHASLGARMLRVRLSNAYGLHNLHIGAASLGLRADGADMGILDHLAKSGKRREICAFR